MPAAACAAAPGGGPCWSCQDACRAFRWAPSLRAARACLATSTLPLPAGFLPWLRADGASLPAPPPGVELLVSDPRASRGGARAAVASAPCCFPELEAAVAAALASAPFRGGAFVKLDWVAPADAGWMAMGGSLRVESAGEAWALLKASERVGCALDALTRRPGAGAGALSDAAAPPLHLVLKAWMQPHRSRELRAFIRRGAVAALCARAADAAAALGADEAAALRDTALDFLRRDVLPRAPLRSCVADIYIDTRGRGWLVDFGPLGPATDALLFSRAELGIGEACCSCADAESDERDEAAAAGGGSGGGGGGGGGGAGRRDHSAVG